jgi:hypothetical protein
MADGWYDEWGTWHEAHPQDLGYSGPHPSRPGPLPPDAGSQAVAEAERIVNEPPQSTSEPIAAGDAVLPPQSGLGLGPVPPGKVGSEGVWVGGVWQERPPRPKVGPVAGLRLYLAALREMLEGDE